jgi:3',5'-cyclic AMP phosphodiesterase CpdA
MARIISERRPDLVINTGDIALDGAVVEDDLTFARGCHATIDVPLRTIPGNHDVGDNPWRAEVEQPITEALLRRYQRHFGGDYWLVDAGAWVLIGVNAQLLGSGLATENEQWAFLAAVPAKTGTRPLALFVHKPLFNQHPEEAEVNHRYVTPNSRRRLGDALRGAHLRLVASGHVHQHQHHRVGEVDHCWGPSTAFVLPDRKQPRIGTKRVGYVVYTFRATDVDVEVVEAPELTNHNLDDFPETAGR